MDRYTRQEGIILKNYRIGEYHKGVRVFTPDNGIIDFTAFGGYKGKSRIGPLVSPVTSGIFLLYNNPRYKIPRIEDFTPIDWFTGLKSDLGCYYVVLFWFETVIRTHGGGESSGELYRLLHTSMQLLEKGPKEKIIYINIQFMIRIIYLLGLVPELEQEHSDMLSFKENPGISKYIEYTSSVDFSQALRVSLGRSDRLLLHGRLTGVLQTVLECSLNTLAGVMDVIKETDEI